jgi:transcriptional regulator GlxA family with amidase domain
VARVFQAGLTKLPVQSDCAHDPRITTVLRLLVSADGIRLEEAARKVNLSVSRLRHLVREELGVPPHRYLKEFRLRYARQLAENTFLSVKEIMAASGFTDLSHFLRDYKAAFGETPSETRRHSHSGQ